MANQMIALTGRPFQAPNLMGAAQQLGTFMTQRAQQKAAARQAEQAQLEMAAAQRKEQRDVAKDDIDLAGKQIDYHYKRATAVANPQGYAAWLTGVEQDSPEFAEFFRTNLPVEKFDRDELIRMVGSVKDNFDATYGPVTTEGIIGEQGGVGVLTRGGFKAPSLVKPPTYEQKGVGGPLEAAPRPQMMPGGGTPARDILRNLASVRNDDEYQTILSAMDLADPTMARQLRAVAPRFNPQVLRQVVAEGAQAIGGADMAAADNALVAGERGGMGGPLEGYVRSAEPFRARVPSPPQGPQPRETAKEAADKRRAVLEVEADFARNAPPPRPTPLTEAQRLARRDALAGNYKKSQALLDKTYGKAGIVDAVKAVRNLSRDQKEAITGYSAYAPSIFGSSKDADTAIKNLKGTVTELGQQAATASGAIGPMAVQEWKIVADMIANLELEGMTAEGLDSQLNIIEEKAKNAARLTQQAYDAQYGADVKTMPEFRLRVPGGGRAAPKPGSQYPVMTPEQVRKAPSGTKFRTTDGRLGVKP